MNSFGSPNSNFLRHRFSPPHAANRESEAAFDAASGSVHHSERLARLPGASRCAPQAGTAAERAPQIHAFHDSHSGNNDQEHVFFDSSQLLPCFIAEAASLEAANAAALSAVKLIQRTTASENSVHRDLVLHPTSNSRDAHMHADWDADDDYDEDDDYNEPPWYWLRCCEGTALLDRLL